MDQPAQQFADRYSIVLDDGWTKWFGLSDTISLPGMFQQRVDRASLLSDTPPCIWPGLMPPDALPVVGNGYGDWLCVRVGEDSQFAEVIHWYHGGGDWIPVGDSIEEAILHDAVDQFRPVQPQMLRGAGEMLTPDHLERVQRELESPALQEWLATGLRATTEEASALTVVMAALADERYTDAVHAMRRHGWSQFACTCDLIEAILRTATTKDARSAAAARYGENPRAIARALFDPEHFLAPNWQLARDIEWQPADWEQIEQLCGEVWQQRQDLAWAAELLGWCRQRRGEMQAAAEAYFAGRFTSSFTNQAVRLRTHWFNQRFGKFSIAQLESLLHEHRFALLTDDYLRLFDGPPAELLERVTNYWLRLADERATARQYAEAYLNYYRAGWDLGAPSLREYHRILLGLEQSAEMAGWRGRARVAQTHRFCLEARHRP